MKSRDGEIAIPQTGMPATVRNRRALITSVEPYDTDDDGRLHLVRLEYSDPDGPPEDQLIWEREVEPHVLQPTALPQVSTTDPMPSRQFDALVRAARWSALSPLLPINENDTHTQDRPLTAPLFGAIQVAEALGDVPHFLHILVL